MEKNDGIRAHDEHASEYDREARETGWFGPEVLFGLCFEYVTPHERLLDIGIGTGLASLPFARAGLDVFGIDGSAEMLGICRSKDFAEDLREFNLRDMPLPYSDGFFDDVICCGVFHLIGDPEPVFKEVSRVIKPGGIFAFNVLVETPEKGAGVVSHSPQGYSEIISDWSVPVFMHSGGYIKKLLHGSGFDRLKELKFLVRGLHEGTDDLACAYVTWRTVV
uniref:Ubiquinone biosynthesis O-methyltransferase, mitochondrial n=1 Tax=Candidatus Methanogaster sp. ANME-2c ERB4 TaxID=2759911 RepID=A0A7G9Y9N7_9EURY|nr:ubiquinone biosynthesis O-methyltransferase, mitochondrial [Methanosarcinales archaeon ANME-2c ERB4]QNO43598.1 ubiquinone biosynthesis O-methyltransferase, mitochondrial [Methanosarcinales archaeon ANME-2c ERB4]QNO44721.1 ubiquinone biosynthesis O-methyltransferase, mitochondrial [Methanosarcinales archaeon ANME-2c ERB4]